MMNDLPAPTAERPDAPRVLHWDGVYRKKSSTDVSWYQPEPEPSFTWIRKLVPDQDASIIDVGGGASILVDRLLDAGYRKLAVLDVAASALGVSRERLARRATEVEWIVADVTQVGDVGRFDLWHDRAVFHFLTDEDDRRRYVELASRSVKTGGRVIVATFALDGPPSCSGLPVERYDETSLTEAFRPFFRPERAERHDHVTPSGAAQPFTFLQLVRL